MHTKLCDFYIKMSSFLTFIIILIGVSSSETFDFIYNVSSNSKIVTVMTNKCLTGSTVLRHWKVECSMNTSVHILKAVVQMV